MRYAVLVLVTVLACFIGVFAGCLCVLVKRADEIEADILRARAKAREEAPQHTVRWTRHGTVECAYRGVLVPLDDYHIVIEGADGPVLVRRADIMEVTP